MEMGEWLIEFGNWLTHMLPGDIGAPQATVRGAQLTSGAALVAALVALVAAIIAGMVALRNGYLVVRTTAQIKHADYRQAWINNLRDEMVIFQSLALESAKKDPENDRKLTSSSTKILLLMNPRDEDYQALLDGLQAVMVGWKVSRDEFLDAHADYIMLCQRILKREWKVTKREMHATAHFFWVRWVIAIGRGIVWMAVRLYRVTLWPLYRWLEPIALRPAWDAAPNWTKWGIRKLVKMRRDRIARETTPMRPNPPDLSELKGRQEALDAMINHMGSA